MKRILLTGSNGQLGYSCKEELSEKFDLICTSRSKSKGTLQLDIFDRNGNKCTNINIKDNPNLPPYYDIYLKQFIKNL